MTEMTEHEMLEAQKRADAIVDKVRDLVALENQVLGSKSSCRLKGKWLPGGLGSPIKDEC